MMYIYIYELNKCRNNEYKAEARASALGPGRPGGAGLGPGLIYMIDTLYSHHVYIYIYIHIYIYI